MKPAATGMGAAVSARASRPSPWLVSAKCSQAAYTAVIANSAKNIVLIEIPLTFGMELLNGTP